MHGLKQWIFSLILIIAIGFSTGLTVYADEDGTDQDEVTNSDIYHNIIANADGTYSIVQRNKVRTSEVFARTVAYNVTNLTTGETITIGRDATNVVDSAPVLDPATGYYYITSTTTLTQAQSATLLAAAASGSLQMDNVMAFTFDGGDTFSGSWDPVSQAVQLNSDFLTTSTLASYIWAQSGGDGAFGYNEGDMFIELARLIGFADPGSFETNFVKLLKLAADGLSFEEALAALEEDSDTDPNTESDSNTGNTDELQGFPVHSNPVIEYYNDSRNYKENGSHKGFADVYDTDNNGTGIIIPSSEKYLTGITASAYAGTFSLGMHSMDNPLSLPGFYFQSYLERMEWKQVGETYAGYDDWDDSNGDGIQDESEMSPHMDPVYGWVSHTKEETGGPGWDSSVGGYTTTGETDSLRAYYLYIYDLDIYDFTSATTTNETFGTESGQTGSQTFNGTDLHSLTEIEPQENGNGDPIGPVNGKGDPIGPVNDTEEGTSVSPINNRPQYSVNLLSGGNISGEGTSNATPKTKFDYSDSHVAWTDVYFENESEKNLGGFTHFIGYDGNGHSAPWTVPLDGTNAANAKRAADNLVKYWVGDGHIDDTAWLNDVHLKHCSMTGYAQYLNDSLTIGYNNHTIISTANDGDVIWQADETYGGDYKANDSSKWPKYLSGVISTIKGNATETLLNPDKETYESTPVFGLSQQYIQKTQDNGEYPTLFASAEYSPVLYYSGKTGYSATGIEKAAWTNNNPIIVQTPVVAPVVMYDDPDTGEEPEDSLAIATTDQADRTTQLLYNTSSGSGLGRDDSLIQLRLDESYWFKFDPLEHLSTQGYADLNDVPFDNTWDTDNIKFDKYVKAKYVHFPFAVCLYEQGNETPTYYPLVTDEDDPGYWIEVYGPNTGTTNLEWTRFYIPSWALEGKYSGEDSVKYKVESINVNDRGDLESAQHDLRNDNGDLTDATEDDHELYVATYKIGVQVSGWIYDFQIVGINNRDVYDDQLSDTLAGQWHDLLYPLAWNYAEKKAGTLNRLGADSLHRYDSLSQYVRYTRSGEIAHTGDTVAASILTRNTSSSVGWIEKNSVVIDNTKSSKYEDAGTAPKGTEFAFSVKTISNLWNDGDSLQITPTFTYLTDDGTKYTTDTGLHVYYNDSTGSSDNLYIEIGSARDQAIVRTVSLSNEMFNGSYFTDDLEKTVLRPVYDSASASFSNRENTADLETLVNTFKNRQNDSYILSNISLNSDLRIFSGNVDLLKENLQYDHDSSSVHSLTDMYIIDSADISAVESCINPSMQTWYGCYTIPSEIFVSTMTPDEINEYASTHGGLDPDDENVWLQDGYLIVNFDIKSHNSTDKNKDLVYEGSYTGSENMWEGQKQDRTAEVGNLHSDSSDGHYGHKIINVDWGDVIIIDMGQTIDDWFSANIFTIQ